jgi:hypothetical protein
MDSQTIPQLHIVGLFASVLLLCSCATEPHPVAVTPRPALPADVTMNRDAGRGSHLLVTLRLESGEELPFLVDTGAPMTILDKSLAPRLGKCLGTHTLWNFGVQYESNEYAAPKLYLGNVPLITDCNALTSDYLAKMSSGTGRPIMGILGMDCLRHYCVQLDFKAGKMRFLDPNRLRVTKLGRAFPLTFSSASQDHPEWIHPYIHHASLARGPATDLLIDTGADNDGALEPELFRRQIREQRLRLPQDTAQDREPNGVEMPQCVWNGATYTDLYLGNGASANEGGGGESSLGLRFLARHLVTLDSPHRTMYLKQTRRGPLVDAKVTAAAKAAVDSAIKPARRLMKNGQLPGWPKEDRGRIQDACRVHLDPDSITFDAVKRGDSSTYHYKFTRASKADPWRLEKAWRTDQDDHTVEEYPIP